MEPCYFEGADTLGGRLAITENCMKEVQYFVGKLENIGDEFKYLISDTVSIADFMLLELLERIQFLTDGRLYQEHAVLQSYS